MLALLKYKSTLTLRCFNRRAFLLKYFIAFVSFMSLFSDLHAQFEKQHYLYRYDNNSNSIVESNFDCQFPDSSMHMISQNITPNYYFAIESISDKEGNLLFFTDGLHVFNRKYELMQGGNEVVKIRFLTTLAVGSSLLILPHPYKESIYDIFYLNPLFLDPKPTDKGDISMNRVRIDMKADSGFGAVVQKDVDLLLFNHKDKVKDNHFSVLKHTNNKDYWICVLNKDAVNAYFYDGDSLSENPNVSLLPDYFIDSPISFYRLSLSNYLFVRGKHEQYGLIKFDTKTGMLDTNTLFNFSNIPTIKDVGYLDINEVKLSPDKSMLYILFFAVDSTLNDLTDILLRLDLSSGDTNLIYKSMKVLNRNLGNGLSLGAAGLNYGLDSKMYISMVNMTKHGIEFSYVIQNPNSKDPEISKLNFALATHVLGSSGSLTRTSPISKFYISNSCLKESIQFTLAADKDADSFYWNFGDTLSGAANTSRQEEPEHTFYEPGRYKVILVTCKKGIYDTSGLYLCLYDSIDKITFTDTHLCYTDTLFFDAQNQGATYLWSTGDTIRQLAVVDTGFYSLEITKGSCKYETNFNISVENKSFPLLPAEDTLLCEPSAIKARAPGTKYTFVWNTGDTSDSIIATSSGLLTLLAIKQGCQLHDSMYVHVVSLPDNFLPDDTSFCAGYPITLDPGLTGVKYRWNTGSHKQQLQVDTEGFYTLTLWDSLCFKKDSTFVYRNELPQPELDTVRYFCPTRGEHIDMDGGDFQSWLWMPGNYSDRYITITRTGKYTLLVSDTNGCKNTDTIEIFDDCNWDLYIPTAFTPNGDDLNESFRVYATASIKIHMQVYNRWGQRIFSSDNTDKGWDGRYKGKPCPTGVYYYQLKAIRDQGETKLYSGTVTLLR